MSASKAEVELGKLLKAEFPHLKILPQYHIKHKRTSLYIDYYIPALKLAFEVDGEQHDREVKFFHKNDLGFLNQQINDRYKNAWCEEAGITLIRFKSNEKVDRTTLNGKIKTQRDNRSD